MIKLILGDEKMFGFLKKDKTKMSAIVVAAGNSTRMGKNVNKIFLNIFSKPVLYYSLKEFQKTSYINEIIVVTKEEDIPAVTELAKKYKIRKLTSVVKGGETRRDSVKCGLDAVTDADYIIIHDGARPCITANEINITAEMAKKYGAAALGCKTVDTLKTVDENGFIKGTVDRSSLWQVQTPQIFKADIIKEAYNLPDDGATDDCMVVEKTGTKIFMVQGSMANIKITTNDDIYLAMAILQSRKK